MLRLSVARYSGVQPPLLARFGFGAVLEQIRAELVVAVLRRDEQRAPAVAGRLVDVGAGRQQHLDRLEVVGARRVDERRQLAAIVRRLPPAHEAAPPPPRRPDRRRRAVGVAAPRRAPPPRRRAAAAPRRRLRRRRRRGRRCRPPSRGESG